MSDREAFEKWFLDTQGYDPFSKRLNQESEERAMTAWEGWQSALQHSGEPVAVVEKGVLNWIDGKQFDRDAHLYTHPQPAVQHAGQGEAVGWQFLQDGKWHFGCDNVKDHRKNTEAAGFPVRDVFSAPQPAVPDGWIKVMRGWLSMRQEPIAWMFQHEDTGRTTFVELGEAEVFAELNPRLQKVCPLYKHPQPVVPEGYMLVLVDDIKRLKFYLEPYDDIKPRDWVTDKQNLRRAHELLYALLSAGKEKTE
jgi:hypothetical protein